MGVKRLFLSCIGSCVCCGPLLAQDSDFGIWTFVGLNAKPSKVVNLYTEAELRTRDNSGTVDCWSLYGEISFRVCSFLRIGGGYTYIDYNHPTLSWESRHRLNGFVLGSYTTGAWTFAVRERYEQVHRMLADKSVPNPVARRTLRSRFECDYRIPRSRFMPYATVELYTGLNTSQGVVNDKIRYTVGSSITVGKHASVSLYYRYVSVMHHLPGDAHVLGAGCRFNI